MPLGVLVFLFFVLSNFHANSLQHFQEGKRKTVANDYNVKNQKLLLM